MDGTLGPREVVDIVYAVSSCQQMNGLDQYRKSMTT